LIYSGWVNDSGDDGSMFLAISPFAGSMFVVIYTVVIRVPGIWTFTG
jgi:hypothetical protein